MSITIGRYGPYNMGLLIKTIQLKQHYLLLPQKLSQLKKQLQMQHQPRNGFWKVLQKTQLQNTLLHSVQMQKKFPSLESIQRTCSNFGIGLEVDIHFGVLLECPSLCLLAMIIILSESFFRKERFFHVQGPTCSSA